jgi:hypothetical protein
MIAGHHNREATAIMEGARGITLTVGAVGLLRLIRLVAEGSEDACRSVDVSQ